MICNDSAGVTVIGLGDMGGALAEALLENNYSTTVWNRSAERMKPFGDKGAATCSDLAEAISINLVSILCVSDHATSMDILSRSGVESALEGRTLIQLSTMTSSESRDLANRLAALGGSYLDGQILSYPADVRENRANIVCSGPRDLFQRYQALLSAMAGRAHYVGERIGAAPTFDKAHLSWAMGNYLVFLQAAAMCASSGVDLRAWCDYNLHHLAEGRVHRELELLATQICNRDYDEGLDASMDVWLSVINKTITECLEIGVDQVHLARLGELAETAVKSGKGQQELGVLFEQLAIEPK